MIDALKKLFELPENTATHREEYTDKNLAAAALMFEVMAADGEQNTEEKQVLKQILMRQLNLSDSAAAVLFDKAESAHAEATDYFTFTRQINEQYSMPDKIQLIEHLWQMATADDVVEAVEQHVIRRIASLLHVSHSDFIAAKLRVTAM